MSKKVNFNVCKRCGKKGNFKNAIATRKYGMVCVCDACMKVHDKRYDEIYDRLWYAVADLFIDELRSAK